MLESVDETFPPIIVLGEDYERREKAVAGGQTEWDLLEVDESLDGTPAVGVLDV